jgi:hypothetical protein
MTHRRLTLSAVALLTFVFVLVLAPATQAQPGTNCQFVCSCTSSCDTACNEREIYCPNNQKPCDIYWYPSTCGAHGTCSGSASCQSASVTGEDSDLDTFVATSCDVTSTETPTAAF